MTIAKFIKQVEQQISEHQFVQSINHPDSQEWKLASSEIHRLAELIKDLK